jgi:septal ring factor EnvC (AmiA/AmiB activator)
MSGKENNMDINKVKFEPYSVDFNDKEIKEICDIIKEADICLNESYNIKSTKIKSKEKSSFRIKAMKARIEYLEKEIDHHKSLHKLQHSEIELYTEDVKALEKQLDEYRKLALDKVNKTNDRCNALKQLDTKCTLQQLQIEELLEIINQFPEAKYLYDKKYLTNKS